MSQDEESKAPSDRPHPLKFRQIMWDPESENLYALSEDGVLYKRDAGDRHFEYVWRRLPTVSSTDYQEGVCDYQEGTGERCGAPAEFRPGSGYPIRCRRHRFEP